MNLTNFNKVFFGINVVLMFTSAFIILRKHQVAPANAEASEAARQVQSQTASPRKPRSYATVVAEAGWKPWVDTLRDAGVPTRVLARLVREGFDDHWQTRQADAQVAFMRGDLDVDGLALLN